MFIENSGLFKCNVLGKNIDTDTLDCTIGVNFKYQNVPQAYKN